MKNEKRPPVKVAFYLIKKADAFAPALICYLLAVVRSIPLCELPQSLSQRNLRYEAEIPL